MNLSFAGCGFLGIYHVGVAVCFRKYAPHLLLDKISGASAGAIAACCLICDLPLGDLTSDVLRVATEARSRSLGPFHPNFNIQNILLEGIEKVLPADAHLKVSGKLHISLTRVRDGKNVIVTQFDTRDDLVQALLASAFIPLFSGFFPPKFKGERYMDGGFSDNLPTLDENTITVSPFCGESDICPRDDSSQLFHINVANTSIELSRHNIYRIARILFPPKPEVLSNMCKQGFDDALRFLHKNNLISCTRCLSVQSTFVVAEKAVHSDDGEFDPECHECQIHRQEALVSNMPDTVLTIFQEAIDSANRGLYNWIFKHRGMKLLSVFALPYTLPADMLYATITKYQVIPVVINCPKYLYDILTRPALPSSAVADTYETRSYQYKVLGNVRLPRPKSCRHNPPVRIENRLLAAAPILGTSLWDASKFVIDQVTKICNTLNPRHQHKAKVFCQLDVAEYGGDLSDDDFECYREDKKKLNFSVDMTNSQSAMEQGKLLTAQKVLSRRSSLTLCTNRLDEIAGAKGEHVDDTFEHILNITSHHDAIMAYYYLDENNKVKVTEIFDLTEDDSPSVQTPLEREVNTHLEFDDDWDESTWTSKNTVHEQLGSEGRQMSSDENSEYSVDDVLDPDNSIFSDPESEWTGTFKIEEPEDDQVSDTPADTDIRPESDQPSSSSTFCHAPYVLVHSESYEQLQF